MASLKQTSVQRNRRWLLKPENLARVRQCRRLIQREFGVTLHLDDDKVLAAIRDYGNVSNNLELRRLAHPIARFLSSAEHGEEPALELAHIPVVGSPRLQRQGWGKPEGSGRP